MISRREARRLWGEGDFDYAYLPSVGRSGGVICLWVKGVIKMDSVVVEEFSVSLWCRFAREEARWMVTNVYGTVAYERKEAFLKELEEVRGNNVIPWCAGGDFNEIWFIEERRGDEVVDRFMRMFLEFMENLAMVDLPMVGNEFTWA